MRKVSGPLPAHLTEKPLSPKKVILDLRSHLHEKGKPWYGIKLRKMMKSLALLERWSPKIRSGPARSAWIVMSRCPVYISAFDKIIDMRRYLVLMETRYPSELREVFRNMERRSNPGGIEKHLRSDWPRILASKPLPRIRKWRSSITPDVLRGMMIEIRKWPSPWWRFWKSWDEIWDSWKEEGCCGDPARRIGNEYLYKMLVEANIETFHRYHVKRILTTLSHCFTNLEMNTLNLEGTLTVIHQTEFLNDLLSTIKTEIEGEDPLWPSLISRFLLSVGRYGISIMRNPERSSPCSIPGVSLKEMRENRSRSFCCGGGERKDVEWRNTSEEDQWDANWAGLKTETRCDATACPYCLTMLEDGLKAREQTSLSRFLISPSCWKNPLMRILLIPFWSAWSNDWKMTNIVL